MYLGQMKETVEMFAIAISKALGVGVVIVDNELNRVSDTTENSKQLIEIRRMSIIGKVISSGEIVVIDDKQSYYVCKNCPDNKRCEITGFIGVPIHFHDEIIGAIALIVPNRNTNAIYKNFRNSKDFLVKMADLLSSKVQNIFDYNNLNLIKKEREVIMDTMGDAIFLVNELGSITYYNKKFTSYFKVENDITGRNFAEFVDFPIIEECIKKRMDTKNKLVCVNYKGKAYYLLFSASSIIMGGMFKGMLFVFRSVSKFNHALNSMTNKTKSKFEILSQTSSNKLKHTLVEAKKLAVSDNIVLIQSEEYCGEELLAEKIHSFSSRSKNCLLKVDCNYHPTSVLETELFGHESSSDMAERLGKIMLSHNGTLFFHEINSLSLYLQKRIVNFIKTKTISQSNTYDTNINTRLIFSTSVQLEKLVETGEFDEELYYWIGSNLLVIPPLRERKEDLPTLLDKHLNYFAQRFGYPVPVLEDELVKKLCKYDWPQNLKELEVITEKIVYNLKGSTVKTSNISCLSLDITKKDEKSMNDVEREHISSMLSSGKSKEEIARVLNISRGTLYRKIKKYNL